jgi:poly-gamma-glutamate synthesis protein (capsule biosynthesis protein)
MRKISGALFAAGALFLAGPAFAQRPPPPSNNPDEFLKTPPKPASVKGRFSVVSVGDLMLARPESQSTDPEFQKVLALLRSGDVAIGNQEGPAFDLSTLKAGNHGEGGLLYSPAMAADYKAMGINIVSVANNHGTDFGDEGLLDSMHLLDLAGVAHAGGGRDLDEARAAGFYATPKGRVGLVSSASTFKVHAGANNGNGMMPGAPGLSLLRTQTIQLVTADEFAQVRQLATELASPLKPAPLPDAKQITLGEQIYRLADKPGLHYQMDLYDHAGLLKAVRDAKAQSDLVVFHIHAHESPTGVDDDTPQPPDFLIKLFHDVVDAGADVVMGGGPHSLRGVEIYKGKPVLYGLAMFYFRPRLMGTPEHMFHEFSLEGYPEDPDPRPNNPEAWYDSVLAITDFDGARVRQVRLYPIDLANKATPASRGLPHLATGERARQILARLQSDSAPFGTKIAIEGDMGVIRVR